LSIHKSIAIKKARKNNLLSMNKQNQNSSYKRVSNFQLKTVRSKRNLEEIKNKCIEIKQQKLDITNATNFVEFKSMKRLATIEDFVQEDVAKRTDRLMRNHSRRILKNKLAEIHFDHSDKLIKESIFNNTRKLKLKRGDFMTQKPSISKSGAKTHKILKKLKQIMKDF
jgi:tRNA isopentenyl-2-thiomethyl-A-37 hydroxylase MiaE